jgi:glycerate kinase
MVAAIEEAGGLGGVALVGAYDVDTAFLDAAAVFAPQKGAGPGQVSALARRLGEVADRFEARFGVDVRSVAGGGAAGGTGGAIVALGGRLEVGYRVVAELVGLPDALARGHLVVTGEGALDDTSFAGKVTGSVLGDARDRGLPVLVVAGRVEDRARRRAEQLGARVVSLTGRFGGQRAVDETERCIARVVADELDATPPGVSGPRG